MTTLSKNEFDNLEIRKKKLSKIYKEAAHPKKERSDLIKQIGKAIVERRKAKKWTALKLAEETGIPRPHLTKTEQGQINPTIESLIRIAEALNCKLVVEFVRNKKTEEED